VFFYGDSVGSEIKSMIDELKSKIEKDRLTIKHQQSIIKTRVTLYMFLFNFIICFSLLGKLLRRHSQKAQRRFVENRRGIKMRIKLGLLLVFQIFECVINGCDYVIGCLYVVRKLLEERDR